MLKTEAIKQFLSQQPYEMGKLYSPDMEVQVNVARDEGEIIQGEYEGLRWQGFTDGLQTWKHFRIPWDANRNPNYIDREIKFDISKHAEAIGMTGWDWRCKRSRWVGFDFDSIVGHKVGLTGDELQEIKTKLAELPIINLFTSTSGTGLHIYVFIASKETIATHTEHAAVARAILSKISALTGLNLESKVDTLGGNMWVWHRNAKPNESYKCIKTADPISIIPANWRNYIKIVSRKVIVQKGKPTQSVDSIVASNRVVELNHEHIKLLRWFEDSPALWWFDDKKQMLVCHTYDLKLAFQELNLKGVYDTISTGKDRGNDQNCFCFPLYNGGWAVRRHSKGTTESSNWFNDSSGWTTCFYNTLPSFRTACRTSKGVEGEQDFSFSNLNDGLLALDKVGIRVDIPEHFKIRPCIIRELRDGRLKISFDATEHDEYITGWSLKKKKWERFYSLNREGMPPDTDIPDELIRHVILNHIDWGWYLYTTNKWIQENRSNVKSALLAQGYKPASVEHILGVAVLNNWSLVNKPFQAEYPGNREWNKNSAQLRFEPERGKHPTWDNVFKHCGESLNETLRDLTWAKDNGIINGLLYLQAWCAACIQYPNEATPYLFFFGGQNTGKSIFHEALSLLFTKGYIRADNALTNTNGFNGELAAGIFCIVEETNLSKRGHAPDRIKDWVTGRTLSIHIKGKTPYDIINSTHWIQCANNPDYCPILPGDTRITIIQVDALETEIPKYELLQKLEYEAPAFLYTLINFELPQRVGRLTIPVIETELKQEHMIYNKSPLDTFIAETIHTAEGHKIEFKIFYDKFMLWLPAEERNNWSKIRVSKEIPIVKGHYGSGATLYLANVSWEKDNHPLPRLKRIKGGRLVTVY